MDGCRVTLSDIHNIAALNSDTLLPLPNSGLSVSFSSISAKEVWVDDQGTPRRIEGFVECSTGAQLVLRMNEQQQSPAICELVAQSRYGDAFQRYRDFGENKNLTPRGDAISNELPTKMPVPFDVKIIALQRSKVTNRQREIYRLIVFSLPSNPNVEYAFKLTDWRSVWPDEVDTKIESLRTQTARPLASVYA